jgi:quercetin dioxygenase-like cupin family protein
MKFIEFSRDKAAPIALFESVTAFSLEIGEGYGEAHIHSIHLGPGGHIGDHRAGFDQLFLVVEGTAWAAGEDRRRVTLSAGQGAYFATGEIHSKGSDEGATVIMIQVSRLAATPQATGRG